MPLGTGEFSNEDGCVSACMRRLAQCNSCALDGSLTFPPVLDELAALFPIHVLQGGGFGEVHLKVTYWPFELMRGHMGARRRTCWAAGTSSMSCSGTPCTPAAGIIAPLLPGSPSWAAEAQLGAVIVTVLRQVLSGLL